MGRTRWRRPTQAKFFEQLGQLLAVGYDLQRALEMTAVLLPKQRGDIDCISVGLAAGRPFEELLGPYVRPGIRHVLSFLVVHGQTGKLLQAIGNQEQRHVQRTQKLRQVLVYPIVLLAMVIILAVGMTQFLLPQFQLMGLGSAESVGRFSGWSVGTCAVSGAVGWLAWRCWCRFRPYQKLALAQRLPIIGPVVKALVGYQMCLQIALLLNSGVSLATVVQRCATENRGTLLGEFGRQAACHLRAGGDLKSLIAQQPLLPDDCQVLLQRGQTVSGLGRDFEQLAKQQFRQFERLSERLIMVVQPLCFCVIGLLVVGLYALMLVPMYQNMGELMTW